MISIESDAWKYCWRFPFDFLEAFLLERRRFSPEAEDGTEVYYLLFNDFVYYVPVSFLNAVSLSVYPSSFDLLGLFLGRQHLLTLLLMIYH